MQHVWGQERCIQGFGGENLRERDNIEFLDLDPGGMIILKQIFELQNVSMDGIELAEGRNKWRAVVKTVKDLRFFLIGWINRLELSVTTRLSQCNVYLEFLCYQFNIHQDNSVIKSFIDKAEDMSLTTLLLLSYRVANALQIETRSSLLGSWPQATWQLLPSY